MWHEATSSVDDFILSIYYSNEMRHGVVSKNSSCIGEKEKTKMMNETITLSPWGLIGISVTWLLVGMYTGFVVCYKMIGRNRNEANG